VTAPGASAGPDAPTGAGPRRVWLRLGLLVAVLGAGYWAARALGLGHRLEPAALRRALRGAGVWSVPLFFAAFTVGELLYVPGLVFVGVAVYVYGPSLGALVALGGALCSVTVAFLLVRAIGGDALRAFRRPLLRRALRSLEARPIFTMFWLRSVFFMAPVLNYALALSGVGFRDYVLASGLGLVVPILGSAWALHWLLAQELSTLLTPAAVGAGVLLALAAAIWTLRRRGRRAATT